MKHRDNEHFSAKNIVKYTTVAAGTYYPDLNLANVFRLAATGYNLILGTPKNPRDGQMIRIEVVSVNAKTINFSTAYSVNGAAISDATHDADVLVIYYGYYNATTSKWNVLKLADKS